MTSLKDQLSQYQSAVFEPYDPKTGKGLTRPEPSAAELAQYYAAPGGDADHEFGVVFRADHETIDDGMCRQARLHASALSKHVPVLLSSLNHRMRVGGQLVRVMGDDVLPALVAEQVGELRHTRMRNSVASVFHTLIKDATVLKSIVVPQYVLSTIGGVEQALRSVIIYTPWERSTVAPDLVRVLNRCGQVWLQCERNRRVFRDAGVDAEKIRLIPNAYTHSGPALLPETKPETPPGRRYYNVGKWEPRKGQHQLIGAFLLAHEPTDVAMLTIKTVRFGKWQDYPSPEESLSTWVDDARVRARGWTADAIEARVKIYDRFFSEEQMVKLHALHNIYVSASHAEGWDYPAFDAKSAGNRLVFVPYGGAEDYRDAWDVAVATYLAGVHLQYGWEPHAEWAEYDVENLADAMRRAEPPATRKAPDRLLERFGAEAVGARMAHAVRELVTANHPQHVDKLFKGGK